MTATADVHHGGTEDTENDALLAETKKGAGVDVADPMVEPFSVLSVSPW